MKFSPYELLDRRREGGSWSIEELEAFLQAWMAAEIGDEQMAAFLMATAIHGMEPEEAMGLTQSMIASGESWNLRDEFDFLADKHSTGGVGDKVSIILAPWLASCGVKVAMLSGRGLGHTGGTLDKLESIPGFRAELERAEIIACVEATGCAIATSTAAIAPADRRMYALRDVTGTVRSIPLITASIMSKKLAMGASALLLDVKFGRGAFMRDLEESRQLARSLIRASGGSGTAVEAMVSDMSVPLGRAIGNALEIVECVETLRGEGPDDLYELTREQAARLMAMSGEWSVESARARLDDAISSGAALDSMRKWIEAQEGDAGFIDDPGRLERAARVEEVRADQSGWVSGIDPLELGLIGVEIGAGRKRQSDPVDHSAGIVIHRRYGDEVERGDVLAELHLPQNLDENAVSRRLAAAWTISEERPHERDLIRAIES